MLSLMQPTARLDASPILAKRLYQGGKPPHGYAVAHAGFDVLVLCAREYQPPAEAFPRVTVIHYPMNDAPITPLDRARAKDAGVRVARALAGDQRVLVTCYMGWNRSGLVSALALTELGVDPGRAIRLVRQARGPNALTNRSFLGVIAERV